MPNTDSKISGRSSEDNFARYHETGVDIQGSLYTTSKDNGHICEENSTATPIGAGETFLGVWQDTLNYNVLIIGIKADQDSATDGLEIQWSTDKTNICDYDKFTISANIGKVFTFSPARRYVRVSYTNGASAQTSFNIQTIFKKGGFKGSSHRINDNIVAEDDAELVKAVLTGEMPSGDFTNFNATTNGNFKISIEEFDGAVKGQQLQADSLAVTPATEFYDEMSRITKSIDAEHASIHNGWHFNYSDYQLNNSSGSIIRFTFTTPTNGKLAHFVFMATASLGATLELFEGATGITGGTTITPRNNDRNSLSTSDMTILKDPTVTDEGTRGQGFLLGGNRQSGQVSRDNEYILKSNTTYLLKITSLSNSNDISWDGEWYEYVGYTNS